MQRRPKLAPRELKREFDLVVSRKEMVAYRTQKEDG